MAACSGRTTSSGSTARLPLLALSLLGLCVALSHQQSTTDSCATAKLAVASLVPFDSTAFRCTAAWKQQDFVLRVRLLRLLCSSRIILHARTFWVGLVLD